CADNFTERNSYEFIVKTHAGYRAWCNGALLSEVQLGGDTIVRHWSIEETMPAYLASVAAAAYTAVRDTFVSITAQPVPVELVARPVDTTGMKNSFTHLQDAFDGFERRFGAYRWNKVGYVLTPQGAMEHATSIHYPASIAGGSLDYENVMAHELAHHWFGDLVTCDRAEEMYINEGFAEYLSYLFLEDVYGPATYRNTVRLNHRKMLQRAHLLDEGWWALSEVPQEWTYGETVYNKGADVLHSLRGYLGDTLFEQGLSSFLSMNAFSPVNTTVLRDHLTAVTGMDMTDYFADWIQQPGWAAFEVDSFLVGAQIGGTWPTNVHVEQKQRGPSAPYHNVPITVTCYDMTGAEWRAPDPYMVGGTHSAFSIAPPFPPSAIMLNTDERLSLAMTTDIDTLLGASTTTYSHSDFRITVGSVPGPIPIIIQEYWVAADPETDEPFAYKVSPDRYWRISGNIPEDAVLSGRITYDGRNTITGALDVGLMEDVNGVAFDEDSLVVLYRPDGRWPWTLHPDQTLNTLGSTTNKMGRIDFNGLRAGEYTLAWRTSAVGISAPSPPSTWTVHPNPATDHVCITRAGSPVLGRVDLIDASGRVIRTVPVNGNVLRMGLDGVPAGRYSLRHLTELGDQPVGNVVVTQD
ncbi:MAG: hypothetical protein KDB84_11315, partial [Flavobacteriales bacterium]|nr:hypothetical protein [Flavobacteriales bacterium]